MNLQITTYIFVGATFALYIGIAIWTRARSTGDFYVAAGGVHPIANGMATAADWMSALFHFHGRTYFIPRLRWLSLLNGMDWRLCLASNASGTILKKVWKVYCSRVHW